MGPKDRVPVITRHRDRRLAPFVGLTLLVGCARQLEPPPDYTEEARQYAVAVCEAAAQCGCIVDQFYSTEDQCTERYQTLFLETVGPADWIDHGCLDTFLAKLSSDPCLDDADDLFDCPVVKGERQLGESCFEKYVPIVPFAQCEGGLKCWDGECVKEVSTPVRQVGDSCNPVGLRSCGIELHCQSDGKCHEYGNEGDPCEPGSCWADMYCADYGANASGTCTPKIPQGEACDPHDFDPCMYADDGMGGAACDPDELVCSTEPWPTLCARLALWYSYF